MGNPLSSIALATARATNISARVKVFDASTVGVVGRWDEKERGSKKVCCRKKMGG
jgi:hypothetical protein